MNIDALLSRFRIQTKVLIFILPFVAAISAVGLTGLYASGLLQNRMEVSNRVLQALSGFRDLTAAMNVFLDKASDENYAAAVDTLQRQDDLLNDMHSSMAAGDTGKTELGSVIASMQKVRPQIDELKTLHTRESEVEKVLNDEIANIGFGKLELNTSATSLQEKTAKEDDEAKTMIDDAAQITAGAALVNDVAKGAISKLTAADKIAFVQSSMRELKALKYRLGALIGDPNAVAVRKLDESVKAVEAVLTENVVSDEAAARLMTKLNALRQVNIFIGLAAQQKMKLATERFAALKTEMKAAQSVVRDSRAVVEATFLMETEVARFMTAPTDANLSTLKPMITRLKTSLATLAMSAKGSSIADSLEINYTPALKTLETDAKSLLDINKSRVAAFTAAASDIDAIWKQLTAFAELQKQSAGKERDSANSISVGATITGILIAIFAGIGLVMTFKGPIGQITSAMRKLAEGVLDTKINGEARIDEIGEMARALGVFKQNALSKIEIEQRSDAERAAADDERRRNDAEKLDIDRQIDFAVNALAAGLGRLAQGDISQTIETPFFGKLETLRADFNSSLSKLQDTMAQIRENTEMIQRNAGEMSAAADDLAKRTEQQAAALEQTAAAVEEITVTVKSSAERAEEANHIVGETKKSADASSTIVASAITAMGRIEDASNQIVQIIDVIDDIAFQTNLLALNAGIEAARAGEAGKGFAVVAQEVRELAQRSAGAAQQIKDLIGKSSAEVSSGSRLVQQTGKVLAEISHKIVTVSERVETIAMASRDQSNALAEVNSSVNSMDQMTQRNAAMVEETNAATRQLADEADNLMGLVQQFRLASQGNHARRAA
ncbi:methyl-accepting chemotaxis protein [Rhizobium sp. SG_E_25_P2]|uniref:methyl-accepting chemotaxis protein n=1 Tax=Rhizobium sp. SG_E_25_P2 TaxID=2879942 RepID=UPI002473418C|nr:HAMP domain-containing methyl-accepting chemotaxis protein [Rhizobium sp. SG_E_25_P2]MDH6266485.1 methyl-accepting chemotaxis protein [Rhizobium sp. SG_E_25_P2]